MENCEGNGESRWHWNARNGNVSVGWNGMVNRAGLASQPSRNLAWAKTARESGSSWDCLSESNNGVCNRLDKFRWLQKITQSSSCFTVRSRLEGLSSVEEIERAKLAVLQLAQREAVEQLLKYLTQKPPGSFHIIWDNCVSWWKRKEPSDWIAVWNFLKWAHKRYMHFCYHRGNLFLWWCWKKHMKAVIMDVLSVSEVFFDTKSGSWASEILYQYLLR